MNTPNPSSTSPKEGEKQSANASTLTARGVVDAATGVFLSVFDTPEKQARYDAALKEIESHLRKLIQECEDFQRLSEKDFSIVINARDVPGSGILVSQTPVASVAEGKTLPLPSVDDDGKGKETHASGVNTENVEGKHASGTDELPSPFPQEVITAWKGAEWSHEYGTDFRGFLYFTPPGTENQAAGPRAWLQSGHIHEIEREHNETVYRVVTQVLRWAITHGAKAPPSSVSPNVAGASEEEKEK